MCELHNNSLLFWVQVDARQIERKAQAAQQSMARRAHRLEKAQAAAAQAHLAAVGRQSSLQKEQHTQPARTSLQQVRTYTLIAGTDVIPRSVLIPLAPHTVMKAEAQSVTTSRSGSQCVLWRY